jgi:uncharacterized membrane protein SirB2
MLYSIALLLHSWIRWAVVLTGLLAVVRGISGRAFQRPWTPVDARVSRLFTITLDMQMLLGVILYFGLSSITTMGIRHLGEAMTNASLRFWTIEHPVGMIIGIVLAHVGDRRIRGARDDARRHIYAAVFFTLAMVVILASVPWPGKLQGRPLFRP